MYQNTLMGPHKRLQPIIIANFLQSYYGIGSFPSVECRHNDFFLQY